MDYTDLLTKVPKQWHEQFIHFVSSGDASNDFLAFLDKDKPTQEAVEMAFSAQVRSFEKFARHLNVDRETINAAMKRVTEATRSAVTPTNDVRDLGAIKAAAQTDPAFRSQLREIVDETEAVAAATV
jgi:hypothetical protein